MRRPAWTYLAAVALLAPSAARAAEFPDKNLEKAVRAALHLEEKAELKDENLKNLYVLEAAGREIRDLSGLEGCTNLSLIKLSKNRITDLKPLKDLKNLQSLDLSGNEV
jgi:Leucine-rich repeat (LRR) protein